MKKSRKLLMILGIVLSLAIATGSTLAYLTDTDSDVNVMTLGNVKIEQLEYERIDTETVGDEAIVQEFHDDKPLFPAVYDEDSVWQPGVTEDDATVTWDQLGNEGSWNGIWDPAEINNEVDKFVFAKNVGTSPAYVRTWFAFELGDMTLERWWEITHLNINDTFWQWPVDLSGYAEETIGDVRYAVCCVPYTRNDGILEPGELSRPSLLQVALDKTAGNEDIAGLGDTYEILVVTQAMQTSGFDNAVAALSEGFGDDHPFEDDMVQNELDEKEYNTTHPVEYMGVRYETLQEAFDLAKENDGGLIKVHAPLQLSETATVPNHVTITIEGLGNKLTRAEGFTGSMIAMGEGSTLTVEDFIIDGGAVWTGETDATLQRGTTNSGVTATGTLIDANKNASIILGEGAVLQNNAGAYAVNLGTRIGATLTMNGGQIMNNESGAGAIWGGGHITVNEGSKISGNSSSGFAGVVRMVSSCNFTMNGGEISHNKAASTGGVFWGSGVSTYNLNGGHIAYNEAGEGGGVMYPGEGSVINLKDGFELHDNKSPLGGAIRFTTRSSLNMTGGKVYNNTENGVSGAFWAYNANMSIVGGSIEDDFTFEGGLGLTIGEADIDGVIHYNLATAHNTGYLAADFNGFSFVTNESASNFANFNLKPASGYTYTAGDEEKLVCLNEGYSTYWDAATGTFRLKAD